MKAFVTMLGAVTLISGAAASAAAPSPVVSDESHDSEIVFVTLTSLMACDAPEAKTSPIGPRFYAWAQQHTIGGKPALDSYGARMRKAAPTYKNPAAKTFLCGRATAETGKMLTGANAAMSRLEATHAKVHRG